MSLQISPGFPMPRRNVWLLFLMGVLSLVCYQRIEHNPYGRYLAEAWAEIDDQALEQVPSKELFESAMDGMVTVLNKHIDENSAFIDSSQLEQFESQLKQTFGGIGVMIRLEGEPGNPQGPRKLMVINPPYPDSPANEAGIKVHDEIVSIAGELVSNLPKTRPMDRIMELMRGEVGTSVELEVLHAGATEPVKISVTRAVINVPSVLGDVPRANGTWDFRLQADPRLGYVRVETFGEKTLQELMQALDELQQAGCEGLILDLRDDSGGRLDKAVEICRLFLKRGAEVVSIRGRGNQLEQRYTATENGPYSDWPLAVLINGLSASASEIVSSCLQDNGRATIIGTRSYGKGTVQHLINLEAKRSMLKLTVARYLRPNGKNIHRGPNAKDTDVWGVLPEAPYLLPLTKEQEERLYRDRSRRDLVEQTPEFTEGSPPDPDDSGPADPQLQKAIEVLQQQLQQAAAQPQAA